MAFSTDFNDFERDLTYMFYRVSVSEHSKQLRLTPVWQTVIGCVC